MSILPPGAHVLFAHAHPDDETLATGALIAHLVASGHRVSVLTATRGERGEIVPGSVPDGTAGDALVAVREAELAGALDALGVHDHAYLGSPPAASGEQRRYRDSGMAWVSPTQAGPAPDAGPDAFSVLSEDDEVADLTAWVRVLDPDLIVSYDDNGGYGHPDHLRMRAVAQRAAVEVGRPFAEIIPLHNGQPVPGDAEVFDLPENLDQVVTALAHHRTQLTVYKTDGGAEVVHVGGQREPVATLLGLRSVA